MMIMYSINDVKRMQQDEDYFFEQNERYCLISLSNRELDFDDVENQANFCILQTINAYKNGYLSPKDVNRIINKIDVFNYSKDLLGPDKVIDKLNKEIIEEELHTPHFNSLCIPMEEIYDSYK